MLFCIYQAIDTHPRKLCRGSLSGGVPGFSSSPQATAVNVKGRAVDAGGEAETGITQILSESIETRDVSINVDR